MATGLKKLLTAFNTPFKKYCFVRLPFRLSASSEIFCKEMDQVLSGVPGTFPCADDVKVQGSTEERQRHSPVGNGSANIPSRAEI